MANYGRVFQSFSIAFSRTLKYHNIKTGELLTSTNAVSVDSRRFSILISSTCRRTRILELEICSLNKSANLLCRVGKAFFWRRGGELRADSRENHCSIREIHRYPSVRHTGRHWKKHSVTRLEHRFTGSIRSVFDCSWPRGTRRVVVETGSIQLSGSINNYAVRAWNEQIFFFEPALGMSHESAMDFWSILFSL